MRPDSVFLQAPDGPSLKVEVSKGSGDTWLDKGWQRFRDCNSITMGNFLLFDYDKMTSRFNVLIFDTSNTEIEYVVATVADQRQVQEPENVESDSIIFEEEILSRKKCIDKQNDFENVDGEEKKVQSRTGDHTGKKVTMSASAMRSVSSGEKYDSGTNGVSANCHSESFQTNKRDLENSTSSFRKLKSSIKDHVSNEHLPETEESNPEFNTSSCLKFEIVLKDYMGQAVCMNFAENAGLMSEKSVTLQYPPKQRCWSVLLEQRSYTTSFRLYFAEGWSDFCKENLLNIGETYSLEFNVGMNVIQVQRVDKNSNYQAEDDVEGQKRKRPEARELRSTVRNCTKETATVDKGTSIAYRMAKAFRNDNTIPDLSFVSFMSASYVSSHQLAIPTSILRDNLGHQKSNIQLRLSSGKMYPVECGYSGIRRNGYIGIGWNSFRVENELKHGDACVFELDKNNKSIWNVTIFHN